MVKMMTYTFKEGYMLKHLKLSQRQKKFCLLFLGIFLLGIGIWHYSIEKPNDAEREVTKVDQTIKTSSTTKINQTIFYEKCQENEVFALAVKPNEVGLNYTQFQALYPKWNIEIFNEEQIKMSLLDSGCCTAHRQNKFIGVQGDYVAIFYGKPDDHPVLKELTQIKIATIHPQALDEVKRGIVFQSNEEMLRILEGLHSK